jgi:hypothetical protein
MPEQGSDGHTTLAPVRFVGVDGPRWFLRAVLSGPAAASDESTASALLDVVKATVVVRGDEAMAPRELLSLKLPPQSEGEPVAADGSAGLAQEPAPAPSQGAPSIDDFKPFERGPEISEIR